MNSTPYFVFDLDFTLLDIRPVEMRMFFEPLAELTGLTVAELRKPALDFWFSGQLYSPGRHVKALGLADHKGVVDILSAYAAAIQKEVGVYADVAPFFDHCRGRVVNAIATYGSRTHQGHKITGLPVKEHIAPSNIFIVQRPLMKSGVISQLKARSSSARVALYVDDNSAELALAKQEHPDVFCAQVLRPDVEELGIEPCSEADLSVSSLVELYEVLPHILK